MCVRKAFGILEVLVVLGVVALLAGLLFQALIKVRQRAGETRCASNLRQIGIAFHAYAGDNQGVMPRYSRGYNESRGPVWVAALGRYLGVRQQWQWADFAKAEVYQCPAHPTADIPTAFVLNCFAFESRPAWRGAPPLRLGAVRSPAQVIWLTEASDRFGTTRNWWAFDDIFYEPFHILRNPDHLPGGSTPRMTDRRHGGRRSNALFLDGHVEAVERGQFALDRFDDRVIRR